MAHVWQQSHGALLICGTCYEDGEGDLLLMVATPGRRSRGRLKPARNGGIISLVAEDDEIKVSELPLIEVLNQLQMLEYREFNWPEGLDAAALKYRQELEERQKGSPQNSESKVR